MLIMTMVIYYILLVALIYYMMNEHPLGSPSTATLVVKSHMVGGSCKNQA